MGPADHIHALLTGARVPFEVLEHAPAHSAEEAAAARGLPASLGGKSLVMKLDRVPEHAGGDGGPGFGLFVVRGDRRIDNRKLRRHLGVRRYRFATRAELEALTGLTPGCVPPFGRPVFPLPLWVDADRAAEPGIAFSLASPAVSVRMATADWLTVACPAEIFDFTREVPGPG